MPKCSNCGCETTSFESLCQGCFDAKYARVSQRKKPKSFRERLSPRCALISIFVFAYAFVTFRTAEFHLYSHPMTTHASALSALLFATIAFLWESGK